MKDKIRYYDRNNVLRLTLNEYPYYSEPSDLKNWIWGFNEQFGVINTFYRNKTEYELVVGIAGDYLPHHDALCDIFSADVIANEPGYLELRGWRLPCYIVEASYEYGLSLDRQAKFRVRSVNSTWIRTNTRSYNGVPGGGLGGEDLGRDYIFSYVPPEKYEDMGEIIKIENDEGDLTLTSLSVSLSPIQDLNGYDAPWVGGAGKNLLPMTLASLKAVNTVVTWSGNTYTRNGITFTVLTDANDNVTGIRANGTATAEATFYQINNTKLPLASGQYTFNGCPSGGGDTTYRMQIRNGQTWMGETGSGRTFTYDASTTDTDPVRIDILNGAVCNNVVFKPMIRLASVSDATYEPYSNICPISGRTEVVTHRTGKNLLPYPYQEDTYTSNGVTFTVNDDGSVTANGTATALTYFHFVTRSAEGSLGFLKTGNYMASPAPQGASSTTFRYQVRTNGTWVDVYTTQKEFSYVNGGGGFDAYSIRIESGATVNNVIFYPMLRLATDTDDTYEPYNGQAYTTSLGRTVYGGTLDVVSGVLTVDRAMVTLDGTEAWYLGNGGMRAYCSSSIFANAKPNSGNNSLVGLLSNQFVEKTPNQTWDGGVANIGISLDANKQFCVCLTGQKNMTVDGFKTWLANNPLQVVYPLATPQTYQLTPQQVSLLVGENNLWTNTGGTIDVKYETISVPFPARGYNYGYSQPESHYDSIDLPGTGNGFEVMVYGPQVDPVIYLNNHPVQVNVELSATERLHIVSNGNIKTIQILTPSGSATDAFVYRDKENTPFITLGQHTDLSFGQIRFDFTTIERRSEPTWT